MFLAILFLLAVLFLIRVGFFFRGVFRAAGHLFSLLFWPIIILIIFIGLLKFFLPIVVIVGFILFIIWIAKNTLGGNGNPQDYQDDE